MVSSVADASIETELGGKPALELESVYREHSALVSKGVRRLWGPGGGGGAGGGGAGGAGAAEAEDLLQEIFLVVQRRLHSFRGEAALTTWLYGITLHVVAARRRKERWRRLIWRRAEPELQDDADAARPCDDFERAESARVVYSVLNELRERDRTLLILFELERLPGAEIASILKMPEAAVWAALTRARARFRAAFEKRWGDRHSTGVDSVLR